MAKKSVSSKTRKKTVAKPNAARRTEAKSSRTVKLVTSRRSSKPAAPPPTMVRVSPADSGLTRKDIAQFRELLIEKRSQLRGDVRHMQNEALGTNRRDAAGDLSNMPLHMADLGTDNYEQEFTLGLIEGEQTLLREIEEALQRIESGTFGVCQATGKPIGKARLRAKPWAKFCYEYTLQQEQRRQRGN